MHGLEITNPYALFFILLLPFFYFIKRRFNNIKKIDYLSFSGTSMLSDLVKYRDKSLFDKFLLPISTLTLILALSNPVVSYNSKEESMSVVLVMDISASMRAVDVQPTRLDVAKSSAKEFIKNIPKGYRVSLIAFDSVPRLLVPPSKDMEVLTKAVDGLTPGAGTSTGDALDLAIDVGRSGSSDRLSESLSEKDTFDNPARSVIVLLSDGAQNGGLLEWESAAQRASRLGIPVHTVAFGTRDGVIDIATEKGLERVSVPPDDYAMTQISLITRGKVYGAKDYAALSQAFKDVGTTLLPIEKNISTSNLLFLIALAFLLIYLYRINFKS